MYRLWLFIALNVGLATTAFAAANPDSTDSLLIPAKRFPLVGQVYVVDPGHGGSDTGTKRAWQGRTWYEKQLTLGLSIELANQIRDLGGTVVSTVITPDSLAYLSLGENLVPAEGATYFNLTSRPPIVAKAVGLARRLEIGRLVMNTYPDDVVHWLSIHFDFIRQPKGRDPISGTRIFYSPETQETTFVQVPRLIRRRVTVNGKNVWRVTTVRRDSVVAIQPSLFVRDLAQAFLDAGWLRDQENRPVVSGGKRGVKHLFVLRGVKDPHLTIIRHGQRKKTYDRVYNQVLDPVLIEYANFNSTEDWERLQQADGSLRRLAEITVRGLVHYAARDTEAVQRDY